MGDSTDKCGVRAYAVEPGTKKIEGRAFCSCYDLEEIEIPSSVRKICRNAFTGCRSLKKIKIPSSVKLIDGPIFSYCTGLEEITVDENDRWYDSREGCNAIIDSETNELISGCKNTVIPASVTKIADKAFEEVGLDDDYLYDVYKKYGNQSAMSYYRNKI